MCTTSLIDEIRVKYPHFLQLKYNDGTPIINVNNPDKAVLFYLLTDVTDIIANQKFNDKKSLLFSNKVYNRPKIAEELRLEAFYIPTKVKEGIYNCKKCTSSNTMSSSSQQRSLDEGETTRVVCLSCQFTWTFNA
jgi:DNA-directed RNA polymerase subunit M/transcription elongation factor TFIIS